MEELMKLHALLIFAGVEHEVYPYVQSGEAHIQICYPDKKGSKVDAVSTKYTYGGEEGLIEVLGSVNPYAENDDVVGWLKAADAFKYFLSPDNH